MREFRLYKASAGSGKTYSLIGQYLLTLFRDTNNYKHILAVTFTNKAANELKSKIINELVLISSGKINESEHFRYLENELNKEADVLVPRAKKILKNILQDYSHFSISTIDEFFQTILRSFTREIGIYTGYQIELNTKKVIREAVEKLLLRIEDSSDIRKWLVAGISEYIQEGKSWSKYEKELISMGLELTKEQLSVVFFGREASSFSTKIISEFNRELYIVIREFENKLSDIAEKAKKIIEDSGLTVSDFKKGKGGPAGYLTKLTPKHCDPKTRRGVLDDRESWATKSKPADIKTRIFQAVDSGLDDLLVEAIDLYDNERKDYATALSIREKLFALGLAQSLAKEVVAVGQENNSFLLALTNPLIASVVAGNPSPFIYERTGSFIDHYMIDEFQDTSDLQWANFKPLIKDSLAGEGSGFVVGDVKQSIYRWRNSNWQLMAFQAKNDIKPAAVEEKTLSDNYRSRQSIIDFNNLFFSSASDNLINYLRSSIDAPSSYLDPYLKRLETAYSDVKQGYGKSRTGGYVEVNLTSDEVIEGFPEHYKLLPELIKTLIRDKAYRAGDIVFLERYSKQCTSLVHFLNQFSFKDEQDGFIMPGVVSSESFMLGASSELRCLMLGIALVNKPDDPYLLGKLGLEFLRLKKGNLQIEDYDLISSLNKDTQLINAIVEADFTGFLATQGSYPVSVIIENLIMILNLASGQSAAAFLIGFKDAVRAKFVKPETLTVDNVLQWWEDEGFETTLSMDDDIDAIRVMTIHKAKGLEFPVVIMANCDWGLDYSSKTAPDMWVSTEGTPFNKLPIVPVRYKKDLEDGYFAGQYIQEKMQIHLDNLNLLYVAFTRAIDRLYVFTPAKYLDSLKRVAGLITAVVKMGEENMYSFGDPDTMKKDDGDSERGGAILLNKYPQSPGYKILAVQTKVHNKAIDRGLVLHSVLAKLNYSYQLPDIISEILESGSITNHDAEDYLKSIERLINKSTIREYFSDAYEILKEPVIITPDQGEIRPDRVAVDGERAVVIEYKTGNKSGSHIKQVKNYMRVLNSMEYEVRKAYVLYLDLEEIEDVSLADN